MLLAFANHNRAFEFGVGCFDFGNFCFEYGEMR